MQIKHTQLFAAAVVALATVASAPVHAAALAMSDLNITSLYLSNATGTPLGSNASIIVLSESRTLSNSANYNGVSGANSGSATTDTVGASLDRTAVCVGPSCATVAGSLYGGNYENNTTANIGPVATDSYALGDSYISGTALGGVGGAITGLTRSDAEAVGPTNKGGSAANLINSATLGSSFTVGTTFSGNIAVGGDAYFNVWVNNVLNQANRASATMSLSITITCDGPLIGTEPTDCSTFNSGTGNAYVFKPAEFQYDRATSRASNNFSASYSGIQVSGTALNFVAGNQYSLTVGQSTLANVSSLPEPASLALVGLAIAGLGVASRRRAAK